MRRRHAEWMDEPDIDPRLHRDALRGLERINIASATGSAVWAPVVGLWRRRQAAALTLLDVACGAGDVAIGIARRASREGVKLAVEGCDISSTAIAHATAQAQRADADVRFFEHDVLNTPLDRSFDVVVCSLFLHHLDENDAVRLLRTLDAAARSLVIVSDLDRSRLGLGLAWLGTRLLSRSPVVHVDGPRSVRAAFTRAEAAALAARASLTSYRLTTHWPCRWRLVVERAT
jgi:2-polyprenyl-3-methyl-5-hydroxy-6-metoxy-1,4-benzoquinol methylase